MTLCFVSSVHCRIRSQIKKIGIVESALYLCGLEAQTPANVLKSCLLYKEERKRTWSIESSIDDKL